MGEEDPRRYRIEIFDDENVAVVTWTGDLTPSNFGAFYRVLAAYPGFRENLNRLYDFRGTSLNLSLDDFRSIFQNLRRSDDRHGDRKVAFLVRRDLHFGLMRMFMSVAEPLRADMGVFRDAGKAKAWLGLPAVFRLPANR